MTTVWMRACLLALVAGVAANAQLADKKVLTLAAVKKIAAAAEAEARKNNWNVAIVILDDGGHLLFAERMDGVQIASIEVATNKARSAVYYRRPGKVFEDQLVGGRMAVLRLPGAFPFEGGLPITHGDQLIGGIGVSGAASQQDVQIAKAGLATLEP